MQFWYYDFSWCVFHSVRHIKQIKPAFTTPYILREYIIKGQYKHTPMVENQLFILSWVSSTVFPVVYIIQDTNRTTILIIFLRSSTKYIIYFLGWNVLEMDNGYLTKGVLNLVYLSLVQKERNALVMSNIFEWLLNDQAPTVNYPFFPEFSN